MAETTTDLPTRLQELEVEATQAIENASDVRTLEDLRVRYLGRKGAIRGVLRGLGEMAPEERPKIGALANRIQEKVAGLIETRQDELSGVALEQKLLQERVDVTLPGRRLPQGHLHPITHIVNRTVEIFSSMGFEVALGPEIEKDDYNYEALNFPPEHPARDMQDTFYIRKTGAESGAEHSPDDLVLRTHTSSVQIRYMETHAPPVRIVCPGRVYRSETPDATHLPMFFQVEGFLVDEGVTFGDLKGVLERYVHQIFSPDISLRFRPSFFPFTEPSAEVDILCIGCKGSGCRLCKGSGYLEILGAGMIHPNVLEAVGYDSEKYTGWAFGVGVERIAMLKWGFTDLRTFYENDIRMLSQF
jgi:phenylalanyl-tRNA synthetase alpha chain